MQSDCLNRNYIKPVEVMSQTTTIRMMHTINFLHKLIVLYDKYFPKHNIRIYKKDLQSPWITTGIKKSSKRKQKLYVGFLKNRNSKNELEYKNYKNFLSRSKNLQKRLLFQPNT